MSENHALYGTQKPTEDLTGQKFGKLTALRRIENRRTPSGKTLVMWECQCDCGNITKVPSQRLKAGGSKSCGCARAEFSTNTKINNQTLYLSKNTFDLSGDYGIGYTIKGEKFLFDLEDYDKIKDYTWGFNNGYLKTSRQRNGKKEYLIFHRLVTDAPDNMVVDHINGSSSTFDNRKSNLRIVTPYENMLNSDAPKNNKSGVKGVIYKWQAKKWLATIKYKKKHYHLGYFENFEDAVNARITAEKELFGEFSIYNRQSSNIPN